MTPEKKDIFFNFLKYSKRLAILLTIIIVLANVFILLTGRTYIYKGLKETYLIGRSGPSIYDSLVFASRKIPAAENTDNWLGEVAEKKLSTEQIESLIELETTSFLVIQHGKVVVEHYFDTHTKNTRSNSFSGSKSVIALLIGIAVDKGMIKSLDQPICRYLDFIAAADSNVTLRHLLGMTSDLEWSESGSNPFSDNAEVYYGSDLLSSMKKKSFRGNPNKVFDYASGNTQLLGLILQKATGQKVSDFMSEHLWKKINAETEALWSLDSEEGREKAFCCLYSTTRDYARLGQLVLNRGLWNEERVISAAMLQELTSNYVLEDKENPCYALQYWILKDPTHKVIYTRGIKGQYVISIPDLDVVIVRTGHKRLASIESGEPYKIGHTIDLFLYLEITKKLLNQ